MPTPAHESAPADVDLAVVGGGVAGLYAALTAADRGARVLVLAKGPLLATASYLAQGGVAAATGPDDDPALHADDTFRAGRGLSRPSAVRVLVEDAPARVAHLGRLGVPFDDELGLEGGHSRRRVANVDGASTGARISRVLAEHVLRHRGIEVAEGERALGLLTSRGRCVGLVTERRSVAARATLLATGGYAAVFRRTTNPVGAVGDGIAMAYRAGAAVADLEFVQFHPTVLATNGLLLSEALRGDGALLLDSEGRRFTDELAPRDVVARAIDARGTALLDLRPVDRGRFPALMGKLEREGFDPAVAPIPVSPAAHYTMGGVVTDLDGRTEVAGLYAAGECACTGVHGANRLASNSLLECLVFGRRAALASLDEPVPRRFRDAFEPGSDPVTGVVDTPAGSDPGLREAMWRDAGLVRDAAGLERLRRTPHPVARLLAESALFRAESRGAHFRADYPAEDAAFEGHVVLRPGREPVLERWS
jgi:L-aspartate oxidase